MNKEKEQRAIEYLRMFEPEEQPYYLCYSGGKDSDCIRILAQLAGVRHEIHHNLTTVDAPETVQYVKSIPNVMIDYPKISMWRLIVKKMMPPTRIETRETLALSARMAVATGLSYGRPELLAKQQKKDLRAFLEGMK